MSASEPIVFEKDIRPILKAHCFQCHGEDGKREGDLDLRLRRLIVIGGESGAAIKPGEANASFLVARIREGEMPPGEKKLSQSEIELIERWIAAGAKTARAEPESIGDGPMFTKEEREFWSFQTIKRLGLPVVKDASRIRTQIDAFILARLEKDNLNLSPEADRHTFVRRAYFDLIGLPPTPEALASFEEESSSDPEAATQRLIDRLLASPQYGERWGRHWLDVAGYADSEGYTDEDQVRPSAWRYRDYVVRSFNADKPIDEFVVEQLAGDEFVPLPHRNMTAEQIERLTATGFLRMAPDGTASGGIDQNVARNEVVADTIKIVSTSLLGLTVGCARCHDHRYDPISHVDYHRMRAIFEPALDWKKWKPPPIRRISMYTDADRELAKAINAEAEKVDEERKRKAQFYIYRTLEEELETLSEELREPLRIAYKTPSAKRSDAQKQLLKENPSVANISEGSLYLYDRRREVRAGKIDSDRAAKEKRLVEETRQRALANVDDESRKIVRAAWQTPAGKRTSAQRELLERHPGVAVTLNTLAKYNPTGAKEIEQDKRAAAKLRAEKAADDLKQFTQRAKAIRDKIPKEGFIRALTETPGSVSSTFLFYRGDHEQPKKEVQPAELGVLGTKQILANDPALPTTGRRLAYARHLTSGQHPLVARVIVNRIWMHHFGRGIVNSPGDFGFLGERPSHPDLLDWLADEFVRSGWQVKHLHRLIMNSTVYRQSSRRTEQLERIDPDNQLFARMSIRRLESEVVRDNVLAVSGQLNLKMFGEPIPVMEDEVGQIVIGIENLDGERKPTATIPLHGEEFRRSLYVQARRSRTLGVLETFDSPVMTPNCPERNASNVAPQSLMLMNSRFIVEYAGHFARRLQSESPNSLGDQISLAWFLATGVRPVANEVIAAEAFVNRQTKLIAESDAKLKSEDAAHRALSNFCQALFSANRFIYID